VSFDLYVNETYAGPFTGAGGFTPFIDWAETLDPKLYYNIIQLAEHSLTEHVEKLTTQIKAVLKNESPPAEIKRLLKRISAAAAKLEDAGEESVLWITDGADGMIEAMIGKDDPDHRGPDDEDKADKD
jgi:hypothetical protein